MSVSDISQRLSHDYEQVLEEKSLSDFQDLLLSPEEFEQVEIVHFFKTVDVSWCKIICNEFLSRLKQSSKSGWSLKERLREREPFLDHGKTENEDVSGDEQRLSPGEDES